MSLHCLLSTGTTFSKLTLGPPSRSSLAHRYVCCLSVLCDCHCVTANVSIFPLHDCLPVRHPCCQTKYKHISFWWLACLCYRRVLLNPGLWHPPGRHSTEASSLCPQSLWLHGLAGQSHRVDSFPLHFTSLSHIGPVPGPNAASFSAFTAWPQPSSWHTTWASLRSQESSHTVPQEPLCQISTRPEQLLCPPWSLILSEKKNHRHLGYSWADESIRKDIEELRFNCFTNYLMCTGQSTESNITLLRLGDHPCGERSEDHKDQRLGKIRQNHCIHGSCGCLRKIKPVHIPSRSKEGMVNPL